VVSLKRATRGSRWMVPGYWTQPIKR
jgi:hypothetical protein